MAGAVQEIEERDSRSYIGAVWYVHKNKFMSNYYLLFTN